MLFNSNMSEVNHFSSEIFSFEWYILETPENSTKTTFWSVRQTEGVKCLFFVRLNSAVYYESHSILLPIIYLNWTNSLIVHQKTLSVRQFDWLEHANSTHNTNRNYHLIELNWNSNLQNDRRWNTAAFMKREKTKTFPFNIFDRYSSLFSSLLFFLSTFRCFFCLLPL